MMACLEIYIMTICSLELRSEKDMTGQLCLSDFLFLPRRRRRLRQKKHLTIYYLNLHVSFSLLLLFSLCTNSGPFYLIFRRVQEEEKIRDKHTHIHTQDVDCSNRRISFLLLVGDSFSFLKWNLYLVEGGERAVSEWVRLYLLFCLVFSDI